MSLLDVAMSFVMTQGKAVHKHSFRLDVIFPQESKHSHVIVIRYLEYFRQISEKDKTWSGWSLRTR